MKHRSSEGRSGMFRNVALATSGLFILHHCSQTPDPDSPENAPSNHPETDSASPSPQLQSADTPNYGALAMGCLGPLEEKREPKENRSHSPDDISNHLQSMIDHLDDCVGEGEGVSTSTYWIQDRFTTTTWKCTEASDFHSCRISLGHIGHLQFEFDDAPPPFYFATARLSIDCTFPNFDPGFYNGHSLEFETDIHAFPQLKETTHHEDFWTATPETPLYSVGPGGLRIASQVSSDSYDVLAPENETDLDEALNFVNLGGGNFSLLTPDHDTLNDPTADMQELLDELRALSDLVDEGGLRQRIDTFSLVQEPDTL